VELPLDPALVLDSSQTDSDISQLDFRDKGDLSLDFLNSSMLPQSGPQSVAMLPVKRERSASAPCKWVGERRSPKMLF
jgi:hypothetical protein